MLVLTTFRCSPSLKKILSVKNGHTSLTSQCTKDDLTSTSSLTSHLMKNKYIALIFNTGHFLLTDFTLFHFSRYCSFHAHYIFTFFTCSIVMLHCHAINFCHVRPIHFPLIKPEVKRDCLSFWCCKLPVRVLGIALVGSEKNVSIFLSSYGGKLFRQLCKPEWFKSKQI